VQSSSAPTVIGNLLAISRPNGSLILTALSFDEDKSIEWCGALVDYNVEEHDGRRVLRWKNVRGEEFLDKSPIFHGGPGAVAALRLLSHRQLLAIGAQLAADAQTFDSCPGWGCSWPLVPQFSYLKAPVDGRVIVYRAARSDWPAGCKRGLLAAYRAACKCVISRCHNEARQVSINE
jgi:hypothetical protein